uniref:hypothetical protein n=1 Tax=Vibrio cholerae TaxID=666 RepID=UPI0030807FD8
RMCIRNRLNSYRRKKKNTIFWLGRVDRDFKVWSLISLLNILKVLNIKINCEFHIIGEGNGLDLVKSELYPFDIIYHGNQPYEDMEKILVDQAALLCAMGTSALEGAKLGIPTILINPLYQHEFEEGCSLECRWVYDSKGFSLGEFRLDNINPKQIKSELNILLSEFLSDPISISKKSYEYVSAYDREDVYNKLLESFLIVPDLKSLKMSLFFSFLSKKIKDTFKK